MYQKNELKLMFVCFIFYFLLLVPSSRHICRSGDRQPRREHAVRRQSGQAADHTDLDGRPSAHHRREQHKRQRLAEQRQTVSIAFKLVWLGSSSIYAVSFLWLCYPYVVSTYISSLFEQYVRNSFYIY